MSLAWRIRASVFVQRQTNHLERHRRETTLNRLLVGCAAKRVLPVDETDYAIKAGKYDIDACAAKT